MYLDFLELLSEKKDKVSKKPENKKENNPKENEDINSFAKDYFKEEV